MSLYLLSGAVPNDSSGQRILAAVCAFTRSLARLRRCHYKRIAAAVQCFERVLPSHTCSCARPLADACAGCANAIGYVRQNTPHASSTSVRSAC